MWCVKTVSQFIWLLFLLIRWRWCSLLPWWGNRWRGLKPSQRKRWRRQQRVQPRPVLSPLSLHRASRVSSHLAWSLWCIMYWKLLATASTEVTHWSQHAATCLDSRGQQYVNSTVCNLDVAQMFWTCHIQDDLHQHSVHDSLLHSILFGLKYKLTMTLWYGHFASGGQMYWNLHARLKCTVIVHRSDLSWQT